MVLGEGESETNGESSINIHTQLGVRWIAGEKLLCSTGTVYIATVYTELCSSVMTWKDGMGTEGREAREGEDVYIVMADLCC